ncbi:hypothetical protein EC973_006841 [Apophysomyces ossiformis]|uniref:CS domain-containing protein n=1 Tax=Apophysomyces ossiformis TaxID=679940 RepID=A0A8H7EUG1_9FUNG|nr:hypothetical protein EC973_006841 [Apophysomyces ossiformis]
MAHHPSILWAERKDHLIITVEVPDLTDPQVEIKSDRFHFKGKDKDQQLYEAEFEFIKPVKEEKVEKILTGRNLTINISKAEEGFWEHLQKGPKPTYLKVDFSKWVDKDDDDDAKKDMLGGMDFSDLIAQAGGNYPVIDDTDVEEKVKGKEKDKEN